MKMYEDDGSITVEFDSEEDYLAVVESMDLRNIVLKSIPFSIFPLNWMIEIANEDMDRLFQSISDVINPIVVKVGRTLKAYDFGYLVIEKTSWSDLEYCCQNGSEELKQAIRTRNYLSGDDYYV